MNIITRIENKKVEFLKRALEVDSVYLGYEEMKQLRSEIKIWEIGELVEKSMVHGLKLYGVNETSHFSVAKTHF